jgi:hypothetical protein
MSARKIESTGSLQQVTLEARQTRLSLSPNSVIIHKNGMEFRSTTPLLGVGRDDDDAAVAWRRRQGDCTGVVISCTGNKHAGYHVSMVFTGLSKQAQARLTTMAFAPLG